MPTLAEQQFVSLDRAVSARYFDLVGRSSIAQQDLDSWWRDYQQLERFAESNSGDARIRQGWSEEKPRYANSYSNLQAKVKPSEPFRPRYTPALYNTSIRVGGSSCGGKSGITQPTLNEYKGGDFTPVSPRQGTTVNVAPSSYQLPSFGDALRSLFGIKPIDAPTIDYPDSPLLDQREITTGVITAIVVGAILYVIHRATKG